MIYTKRALKWCIYITHLMVEINWKSLMNFCSLIGKVLHILKQENPYIFYVAYGINNFEEMPSHLLEKFGTFVKLKNILECSRPFRGGY